MLWVVAWGKICLGWMLERGRGVLYVCGVGRQVMSSSSLLVQRLLILKRRM